MVPVTFPRKLRNSLVSSPSAPKQDIVDHRLGAITNYIATMADGVEREFTKGLFTLLNETTEKTGNVVQFSGSAADDFFNVLNKIELGCDRYGRPTMPSLHTSPETGERMMPEIDAQPIEFWEQVEELRAQKERDATAREADRISRFRW